MKLPFLSYFKKEKAGEAPAPVSAPAPIAKPPSERLGKTVMPNMSRVMEPDAPPATIAAPLTPPPAPAGPRRISFGGETRPATTAGPKPLAPSVTPAAERTVALPLVELLPQIPAELLEQTEVDPAHRVLLNATELERGLANGRPAVALHSIYQQAPTIFASEIGAGDEREITLPFDKVLQQIAKLHVRSDQESEEILPQMETPFSQVTLEDSERFGTPLMPLPSTAPAARVEIPAAGENIPPPPALAPAPVATTLPPVKLPAPTPMPVVKLPSPVAPAPPAETPAAKAPSLAPIRLPMPPPEGAAPADSGQAEARPSDAAPSEPNQPSGFRLLTPKISPNGTGAPATERVPASSGSSVPIPLPAPFAPPARARIPFKITPPASDLCPPPPLPLQPAAAAEAARLVFSEGPRIRLSLRAILREVPPFQFTGSIEDIPESAQIELPFAIVEPQLSLGRVAISPAQFHTAMPEEFRAGFILDEGGLPVSLPLPEVLQNLPNESLQLRDDQEQVEVAEVFETPFSQKAAEDAARLHVPAAPIAKGDVSAGVAEPVEAPIPPVESPNEGQEISATIETPAPELLSAAPPDAKSVVARASQLPGVSACAAVFSDGLCLAGNIPSEYQPDALCAMAPEISKRVGEQLGGANFGAVQAITVFCEKAPVSFFTSANICLAALHSADEIGAETRARLSSITEELAQIYAQPAA